MNRFATLILLLLAAVLSLADPAAATREMGDSPERLAIPRPDLSAMEETARNKIESMQGSLETLQQRSDIQPEELSEAVGHLGQLFHAYRLLDSAEECYEITRRLAPDDHRWSYYLALVRHAQGDLAAAIEDYQRALTQSPDNSTFLLRQGDALLELDRVAEARERFSRVREIEPENAGALYGLGKAAGVTGDYRAAAGYFEQALELQPEASVLHYLLGQAYRKLDDLDKAREHLLLRGQEDVVFTDPLGDQVARLAMNTAFEIVLSLAKSADDYSDEEFLGFALSHFGDVRGSIEQLKQGLTLEQEAEASAKEQSRIHYVLGGLLVNDDRDDEAIEQFTRALELAPELLDARVKLGNVLARKGKLEEAIAAYDQVASADPRNATVLLKRISALMELGRDTEARQSLEMLQVLTPESSEVQVRLATILEKRGDAAGAIERYKKATTLDLSLQERPMVHFRLASLLHQSEEFDQALEHYGSALEADPELAPAIAGVAGLMAQLGQMDEAAKFYGALSQLAPDQLQPRVAEATALILSGQHAAARARLEAALELFPGDLQIIDILARHLAASPDRAVRDGERAIRLAQKLFAEVPSAESAETLAMAHAEAGDFAQAIKWQQQLIDELVTESDPAMAQRLRVNLSLYQRGEACCVE